MSAVSELLLLSEIFVGDNRPFPAYWGPGFVPCGESLKQTSLNLFFHLGAGLEDIRKLKIGMEMPELLLTLVSPQQWLVAFIRETEGVPLPDSRIAAERMLEAVNKFMAPTHGFDMSRVFTQNDIVHFFDRRDKFEEAFEREQHNLDVFTVLPKGIYNSRELILRPENKFPESVRRVFTDQILYDLRQAGKCLAFDIPTACAFHVLRATESLMRVYYEALAGHPWPLDKRDWGIYITELEKLPKVNKDAVMRLGEIRKFERNPNIHPEAMVSIERAPILFELCTGVIYTMAVEIGRCNLK